MTGAELRDAIVALIDAHPGIAPSKVGVRGRVAHAWIYVTEDGMPLAIEPERTGLQNLWTRRDAVNPRRLSDILSVAYDHRTFDTSKPNHNLFGEQAFKDADLVRYRVADLWQAARVIMEVAGRGMKS